MDGMHNISLIQKHTPYRLTTSNTPPLAQVACCQQPRTLTCNEIFILKYV